MLRKLNDTLSTSTHLSVRAASNGIYLPCMPANPTVPLAARLCRSPELGANAPRLEDLLRSLVPYQGSLAAASAGGEVRSCRTGEKGCYSP